MTITLTFENVQELNEFLLNNNQQASTDNDAHTRSLKDEVAYFKDRVAYLKDKYDAEMEVSARLEEELKAIKAPIPLEQVRVALRNFDDSVENATESTRWHYSLKIPWVKLVRSLTGLGLMDAKDAVLNSLKFDEYVPPKDVCKDDEDSYDCYA